MPNPAAPRPTHWIIMGVSGCGKTTVGQALADRLDIPFFDADDYHPPVNVAKMSAGHPLTDDDRAPWLATLNELLRHTPTAVLACSALKATYRRQLAVGLPHLQFVFLDAPYDQLLKRMQSRHHFMPPALLQSQFDTLERPTDDEVITLDAGREPGELAKVISQLA